MLLGKALHQGCPAGQPKHKPRPSLPLEGPRRPKGHRMCSVSPPIRLGAPGAPGQVGEGKAACATAAGRSGHRRNTKTDGSAPRARAGSTCSVLGTNRSRSPTEARPLPDPGEARRKARGQPAIDAGRSDHPRKTKTGLRDTTRAAGTSQPSRERAPRASRIHLLSPWHE
jgi:hypothetical protein